MKIRYLNAFIFKVSYLSVRGCLRYNVSFDKAIAMTW